VLNAADYGVPQNRKRLVVVGLRDGDSDLAPPPPTHFALGGDDLLGERHAYKSVAEAIGDLPDVTDPGAGEIPNHEPTLHTPRMLEAFATLEPGRRDRRSFHDRLHADRLSYTLRAGSGNYSPLRPVHYRYDRVVSVRESARLQGFGDDFIWPGTIPRLQQYRQVGNAVPPPLGRVLGEFIAGRLGWQLDAEGLRGDPTSRPSAFSTTAEERLAARAKFMRGASLGGS
jgi:DNA (cytosine-5)-methyltransferase 1